MGSSAFSSDSYSSSVSDLKSKGISFARSATAAATGKYDVADNLNPLKLRDSDKMRECCYAPGFTDAMAIIISMDCTGSMGQVPFDLQKLLPTVITPLVEKGITDRPNILVMAHDDERIIPPTGVFQMSQFETDDKALLAALNEVIIPRNGGGNRSEGYHMAMYAAARHTKCEAWDRDGIKGYFFMVCDEEPFFTPDYDKHGMTPELALATFGDTIEKEIPMLDSLKELATRFNVFAIRPGCTSQGKKDSRQTELWRKLFEEAGIGQQHILCINQTEEVVPTIVLTIGSIVGADTDDLADVLKKKGVNVDAAVSATRAIVPAGGALATVGSASGALSAPVEKGRERR